MQSSSLEELYNFLLEINITNANRQTAIRDNQFRECKQVAIRVSEDAALINETIEFISYYNENQKNNAIEREKKSSRYYYFVPAYKLDDILQEYFPEQNPGTVIGEYCRDIFENKNKEESFMVNDEPIENQTLTTKLQIQLDSEYFKIVKTLTDFVLKSIDDNEILFALICINKNFFEKECTTDITVSIKKILKSSKYVCQSLFDFIVEIVLSTEEIDDELVEIFFDIPLENILNRDQGKIFFRLKYMEVLFWILHNQHVVLTELRETKLIKFLNGIKHIRQNIFLGNSPISLNACFSIACYLDSVGFKNIEEIDYLFMIGSSSDLSEIFDEDSILLNDSRLNLTGERKLNLLNARWRNYTILINKILKDGMVEFASALSAFLIFSQSYYFKGAITNTENLIPFLKEALLNDCRHMVFTSVKLSLELICLFPEEPGNNVLKKVLTPFIKNDTKIKLFSGGKYTRNSSYLKSSFKHDQQAILVDIENDLLGKRAFALLSSESKKHLIEGEKYWRGLRCIGNDGVIKDWSALISIYCKVFEQELVCRFERISNHNEYKSFLKDKKFGHDSSGQILNLLQSFPQKFSYLLEESGLKNLKNNQEIFQKIRKIVSEYRNPASHAIKKFEIEEYLKFRNLLFGEEHLMARFIECLNQEHNS